MQRESKRIERRKGEKMGGLERRIRDEQRNFDDGNRLFFCKKLILLKSKKKEGRDFKLANICAVRRLSLT
jgi:hypothetical protein